jgi:hypothetical protein
MNFSASIGVSYKQFEDKPLEASLKINSLGLVLATAAIRPLSNLLVGVRTKTNVSKMILSHASVGAKLRTEVKNYPVLLHMFLRLKPYAKEEDRFKAGFFVGTRVWQDVGVGVGTSVSPYNANFGLFFDYSLV